VGNFSTKLAPYGARALLAPQDIPAGRLTAFRAAFDKPVVDPGFSPDRNC